MRMRGGEDERPQIGAVEPNRQLPPNDSAGFAAAAAGDDFDAADMIGGGTLQKTLKRQEGGLGGLAMEIQGSGGGETAAVEAVPGRAVQPGRVKAGDQGAVGLAWIGRQGAGRRWRGG